MTLDSDSTAEPLLGPDDPLPVEIYNGDSTAPTLLICDHAGRAVPRCLGTLGLDDVVLHRHIAWDIGAALLARELARSLNAPLITSVYSRLVCDVNRRANDPTSVAAESDGTPVPGNQNLSDAQRVRRQQALCTPYHEAIDARLTAIRQRGQVPMLLSIHSFTPVFKSFVRPWHVGVLWNRDGRLAMAIKSQLESRGFAVGDNQPYSGQDGHGYTMPRHVEGAGFPHVLIEVRQNLIDTPSGVDEWARIFHAVLAPMTIDPKFRGVLV
jgi:predicted N-formylglutamate amidohydrolase